MAAGPEKLRVFQGAGADPLWRARGQAEQHAKVRRVLDSRRTRLEQLNDPEGRRGDRGLETEAQLDGEIVVPASYQLGRTLIEHDLADELRLVVFPVVLGAGERFFGETSGIKPMRLIDARIIGNSLAFLTYQFV